MKLLDDTNVGVWHMLFAQGLACNKSASFACQNSLDDGFLTCDSEVTAEGPLPKGRGSGYFELREIRFYNVTGALIYAGQSDLGINMLA
ncbi:hypothetical protein ElyMa_005575900 [Elysia marginata]|uniref:Uncharacterized protein n=1 Tax=Elysia marginata TaxID=1093978 RepID=A0AAV4F1H1_9GAST|nr:hypothetical protein ElyMa_005575900 [Elysia marginata]